MASLLKKRVILFVFFSMKTISSQDSDFCLTNEAKSGRCVHIDHCPFLRDLAQAAVLSIKEKLFLKNRLCGVRKVCCEEPSDTTSNLQTLSISTTLTRKPIDLYSPSRTATPAPGRKMTLPDTTDCGLDILAGKISGGEPNKLEQFPWVVALEYRNEDPPVVKCGGSLINTRYVITAAHCVTNVTNEDLIARLGEYDLTTDPDCDEHSNCNPEVIKVEIADIKIHVRYKQLKKQNDIALLKLLKALSENYDYHVQPICLPQSNVLKQDLFINRNVSVAGWGKDGTDEMQEKYLVHNQQVVLKYYSRIKMFTNLVTISVGECQRELFGVSKTLIDSHICAKSADEMARDSCGGDSGGPLMISINGNWYLIGVVNSGPTCGRSTLPGVYARVTSYVDWIKDNLID